MNTVDGARLPVREPWFRIDACPRGIWRIHEPAAHDFIQGSAYFVKGRDADLLVDACTGIASLRDALGDAGLLDKPVIAVATHAHYDHVGSLHEFETRLIHPAEADELIQQTERPTLDGRDGDPELLAIVAKEGIDLPELLVTAVPRSGYDVTAYGIPPAPATGLVHDDDVIDLGDRRFTVLHLPGHSPGGIGLLEETSDTLFIGDTICDDGLVLAEGPGTDLPAYIATMKRLDEIPVSVVYGGHGPPFDGARMRELIDAFLAKYEPAQG